MVVHFEVTGDNHPPRLASHPLPYMNRYPLTHFPKPPRIRGCPGRHRKCEGLRMVGICGSVEYGE